jgi:Sec-independent protein translocase protein TatA
MSWFQNLCRNLGLTVHNVKKPIKDHKSAQKTTEVTKREVEEEQIDENITLRRTTIEEIEMKPGADKNKLKHHQHPNKPE